MAFCESPVGPPVIDGAGGGTRSSAKASVVALERSPPPSTARTAKVYVSSAWAVMS